MPSEILSPYLEWLCNKLPRALPSNLFGAKMRRLSKIHHLHVDCSEARGTPSTMIVETVKMNQNWGDMYMYMD